MRYRVHLAGVMLATLAGAPSLHAQSTVVDARLRPWLGCWSPTVDPVFVNDSVKAPSQACIVPSATVRGSVDVVLLEGRSVTSRAAIPLPGTRTRRTLDDCEGEETSWFSNDDRRLLLQAELVCAGRVKRVESGLLAMTSNGDWMQIQHLDVGGNAATTVTRMRFRDDSGSAWQALGGSASPSTTSLRLAMGAPITTDDVIEVSRRAPAALTEAWLVEVSPKFALDGRKLVQLSKAGLSPRVIDLMVAVSHPEAFAVGARNDVANFSAVDEFDSAVARQRRNVVGSCSPMDDFCYGPGGMGAWGLGWQYGAAAMWNPWSLNNRQRYGQPYGYNPYYGYNGYGWNAGWGNGYYGNQPIIIINRPPSGGGGTIGGAGSTTRARAVRGGGYTRETPTSGTATGTRSASPSGGGSGSARGSSSSGSGSSSGSSSGTQSGSSSGSTTGSGRTAKPRPPGGGN